jgi:hypothetical protein
MSKRRMIVILLRIGFVLGFVANLLTIAGAFGR